MKTVQLVQLNNSYGNQVYLPYSAGILKSFIDADPDLSLHFDFRDFIFLRDNLGLMLKKIGSVDILAISCYVWNWELSIRLADEVRKKNPDCLIVLGGPQVPNDTSGFFEKYPFIDVACHGEGEKTFHELLSKIASNDNLLGTAGTTYHNRESGAITRGPPRDRIKDLNQIPSPYLQGTFNDLLKEQYSWMVTWETNRGCPFKCTFCDWGSAIATKVRKFDETRLMQEIDFFAKKKINLVFGADANFGIFRRDKDLAVELAKKKTETGYPDQFRVCFTKNSTDKIFELAKIFSNAGMNKGVSVSMQSLNTEALDDIKRSNIKLGVFKELQKKYVAAGLVTYTELILPLPGETYASFKEGIDTLLDSSQHSGIVIYNCTIMPNAEMGEKAYQEKFGFDMIESPIFQAHSSRKQDGIPEKETVLVGTDTMPRNMWRESYKFAWAIQCFHLLGLLQVITISLRHRYGISYSEFYESLMNYFCKDEASILFREMKVIDELLDGVLEGCGFDQYVDGFEDVSWPAEEASFLRILENKNEFYSQISGFIFEKFEHKIDDSKFVEDLLTYQQKVIVGWDKPEQEVFELNHNIHEYFSDLRSGKLAELNKAKVTYERKSKKNYRHDKALFSREAVWYGRKGGKFFDEVHVVS